MKTIKRVCGYLRKRLFTEQNFELLVFMTIIFFLSYGNNPMISILIFTSILILSKLNELRNDIRGLKKQLQNEQENKQEVHEQE